MKFDGNIAISQNPDDIAVLERMRNNFNVLYAMTEGIAEGKIKGLTVVGPPGIGKSHNVKEALENQTLFEAGFDERYQIVSGYMTTINLFMLLYKHRHKNHVIVLDDIDSVFAAVESLNILKAALDSSIKRTISYMAESAALRKAGIPKTFDFEGGIVLITNIDFETYTGKNKLHLEAIMSRCHYLDLSITNNHEKLLWLKEVVINGKILNKKLSIDNIIKLLAYVEFHRDQLRELSLRMISKITDLIILHPDNWQDVAKVTCMK